MIDNLEKAAQFLKEIESQFSIEEQNAIILYLINNINKNRQDRIEKLNKEAETLKNNLLES